MPRETPQVPLGAYVEVKLENINQGRFLEQIDEALQKAARDLMEWEQAMEKKDGSFTVTAKVTGSRVKNATDHFTLKARVTINTPDIEQTAMVKGTNGRIICQPEGADHHSPDQIRMFDVNGNPKGLIDPVTGEIEEEPATAGKINSANQV